MLSQWQDLKISDGNLGLIFQCRENQAWSKLPEFCFASITFQKPGAGVRTLFIYKSLKQPSNTILSNYIRKWGACFGIFCVMIFTCLILDVNNNRGKKEGNNCFYCMLAISDFLCWVGLLSIRYKWKPKGNQDAKVVLTKVLDEKFIVANVLIFDSNHSVWNKFHKLGIKFCKK